MCLHLVIYHSVIREGSNMTVVYSTSHYEVVVEEHPNSNGQYVVMSLQHGVVEFRATSLPQALETADMYTAYLEDRAGLEPRFTPTLVQ